MLELPLRTRSDRRKKINCDWFARLFVRSSLFSMRYAFFLSISLCWFRSNVYKWFYCLWPTIVLYILCKCCFSCIAECVQHVPFWIVAHQIIWQQPFRNHPRHPSILENRNWLFLRMINVIAQAIVIAMQCDKLFWFTSTWIMSIIFFVRCTRLSTVCQFADFLVTQNQ